MNRAPNPFRQRNLTCLRRLFHRLQIVTEGLRYGVIETPEKYYLSWKEDSGIEDPLDRAITQLCNKERLLEVIHDFMVFDAGTKKTCRHNQYFGVRAAQQAIKKREGGIIWHTQGSGKSLTMVWLAKWIREHVKNARVLLITDRTELDEQIEKVFKGVDEDCAYRKLRLIFQGSPTPHVTMLHEASSLRTSLFSHDLDVVDSWAIRTRLHFR